MQDFWNKQYKSDEYLFGNEPNEFFRTFIDSLPPGKILLPGAGEGRNAVYAADAGWEVDAFDFSPIAREKALRFALDKGVDIHYSLQDARKFNCRKDYYDVVAIIFLQLPPEERRAFHREIIRCLKPNGGNLYLLGFSKNHQPSGGSSSPGDSFLYSQKELLNDFKDLQIDLLQENEVELNEGKGHQGKAHIIKLTALRRPHEEESDRLTI